MISIYSTTYSMFCGLLQICADEQGITSISFMEKGQMEQQPPCPPPVMDHLNAAVEWLDAYQKRELTACATSRKPYPKVKLHMEGSEFQRAVWEETMKIAFGETTTYGVLARRVAQRMGKTKVSAQAVGGALKQNHIILMIPCHRVIGAGGKLGGYMGKTGTDLKRLLLIHEEINLHLESK